MNKLIFFVDDDKMMLNLMEYTFNCREGFDVKSFYSGEDCLKNIHLNPELIVLDYYMGSVEEGSLSGLDTLKKIRELGSKATIVALSREKDEATIAEFIENGAQKYVVKDDYFIDTLIDTIEKHFKKP